MELVTKRLFLFLCFLLFSSIVTAQSKVLLHDALIELSKQHQLSLIFNPDQVDNIEVSLPKKGWTIKKQLSRLLDNTDVAFKVEDGQIFIFINHRIYGYLEDAESGERLIAATILSTKNGHYDIANESGYFTLSTIEDSLEIEVSYLGYATLSKTIRSAEMDRPISIGLSYDNNVEEIVISDELVSNDERKYIELNKGSDILLYQNQASSAIGGEPDIFQAMIRQSGINSGPDGIGGIHVRGGRNDQNQILYDGVRLYNSAHAFGVYSIINSNIIDQARLYKSGANGANSGRLSSVMDVRIKDPNLKAFNANIQVSTIASQAYIELPIIKNKLSIMMSGRRSHIDPFVKSLTRENKINKGETGQSNFYFDDVSIKLFGKISNNQRLYLSLYQARDYYEDDFLFKLNENGQTIFEDEERSTIDWSNKLASLRYNILLGNKTFANFQLSTYRYGYVNDFFSRTDDPFDVEPAYLRRVVEFDSGVTTYDAKLDFQTNTNNHELKYGVSLGHKDYQGGLLAVEELPGEIDYSVPLPEEIILNEYQLGLFSAEEVTFHFTDKYRYNTSLLFEAGVYATHYRSKDQSFENTGSTYNNIFGYFKSLIKVSDGFHIGSSLGTFVQNEHLLTVGDNGYPSDIWLPSTELTSPERSYQAEVFGEFSNKRHSLKASAYYKIQNGLVVLDTAASLPTITNLETDFWEEDTFLADAKGLGLELDYSYSIKDKFTFRSVYTAGFTDYFFDGEFIYPFEYSIPHSINIALSSQLTKRIRLSLDWFYSSGRPYTLYSVDKLFSPIERTETGVLIEQVSGNYNDSILPNVHKLSGSFSTFWYWGGVKNNLTLGIQNIYNQKNLLYTYDLEVEENLFVEKVQTSFPLMPIFKWRVEIK